MSDPKPLACHRCGYRAEDVFTLRHGRNLCVVCMGLPDEYERFVAAYFGGSALVEEAVQPGPGDP